MQAGNVLADHLVAGGPDEDHRDEMQLFGQFIGSWQIAMRAIDRETGEWHDYTAEWHFGWAIGGRAIQDVLITRLAGGDLVGYGTTVRTFDPRTGAWWIVWQDPLAGEFVTLLGHLDGDRIVLEGQWIPGGATRPFRWTFSKITDESFRWECHVRDNGEWGLVEEMSARRMAGGL